MQALQERLNSRAEVVGGIITKFGEYLCGGECYFSDYYSVYFIERRISSHCCVVPLPCWSPRFHFINGGGGGGGGGRVHSRGLKEKEEDASTDESSIC